KLETLLTTTERGYLTKVEHELNNAQQIIGISLEEEAELLAITNYLTNPELRNQKLFRKDELELKKIGSIVNDLDDFEPFFTHLKDYLKDKKGIPPFPEDNVAEQDKLNYFFTLSPQYVIGAVADYHIKTDNAKKEEIETEMRADRNPADKTKSLDWNIYGDGVSPTEAGTKKYYFKKLSGINHSYAKNETQKLTPTSKESF
ncbi:1492_t:CDS:2, partial [Entrophospora sp. SA101]